MSSSQKSNFSFASVVGAAANIVVGASLVYHARLLIQVRMSVPGPSSIFCLVFQILCQYSFPALIGISILMPIYLDSIYRVSQFDRGLRNPLIYFWEMDF